MWYCRAKLGGERGKGWIAVWSDKGIIHVINFLKQRITTAGANIRRYNQRNLQYHQNNVQKCDRRQFYKELDGKMNGKAEAPDPKRFWVVEEGERETMRHAKTRKRYHHSEATGTSYSRNVLLESSRTMYKDFGLGKPPVYIQNSNNIYMSVWMLDKCLHGGQNDSQYSKWKTIAKWQL